MKKIYQKEFIVGKNMIVHDVEVCKGDVIQILPIEFLDHCEPEYRDYVKECEIQDDLAVDVSFFTPENYRLQYIDGTVDSKVNFPLNIFQLPDMFSDLKVKSKTFYIGEDKVE